MMLLRSAARTMLASYFIVSGVKAVRNPEALVPAAEPLVDTVIPQVQRFAPEQVGDLVPTDAKTWIRINGILELAGGLALATGKGRRLGASLLALSLVPTTIGKYPFWRHSDPDERAAAKEHFLKNVSLLGGVLIASRDTEGKPGLGWRASQTRQQLKADTKKAQRKVSKQTKQLTDAALAEGALLVGAVVGGSQKARKQITATGKSATKQAVGAKDAAAKAARQAQHDAAKRARHAQHEASRLAKAAGKEVSKQSAAAKKAAAEFAENIQLGEN